MRLLREALLSVLVMGLVLYLYIVAAGAVLCGICGFVSHREKPVGRLSFENRSGLGFDLAPDVSVLDDKIRLSSLTRGFFILQNGIAITKQKDHGKSEIDLAAE